MGDSDKIGLHVPWAILHDDVHNSLSRENFYIKHVLRTNVLRTIVLRTIVLRTNVLRTNVLRTNVLRTIVLRTNVSDEQMSQTNKCPTNKCPTNKCPTNKWRRTNVLIPFNSDIIIKKKQSLFFCSFLSIRRFVEKTNSRFPEQNMSFVLTVIIILNISLIFKTHKEDIFQFIHRYKHNSTQVEKFDRINSVFIGLFFVTSCSLIAYIPFEIYYYENLTKKILDIIVLFIFIPIAIILFMICCDVETVSERTKKLIEDYIINNELKNSNSNSKVEYHITFQTFNALLLSRPSNLSFFGLASISVTTIGFVFLHIVSNLQFISNLKTIIESRILWIQ